MSDHPIIVVCPGNSPMAAITRHAAQELVLAGRATWLPATPDWREEVATNMSSIVVDGCDRQCLRRHLQQERIKPHHSLCLTVLGIDAGQLEKTFRDDLTLTRDAIIAECTEVSQLPLIFMQKCGCR